MEPDRALRRPPHDGSVRFSPDWPDIVRTKIPPILRSNRRRLRNGGKDHEMSPALEEALRMFDEAMAELDREPLGITGDDWAAVQEDAGRPA